MTVALGKMSFSLLDLCSASELIDWLQRVGGGSPREWLDQVYPLVEYYQAERPDGPIDTNIWIRLRKLRPPRFQLDEEGRHVRVGGRIISLQDVPAKAYDMLRYMYRRNDQVVSKAELYFVAYRGLASVPRSVEDKDYESPTAYEGLVDTSVYRLRQAIEPDPSNPVLLVTVRGHGVRLVSRW